MKAKPLSPDAVSANFPAQPGKSRAAKARRIKLLTSIIWFVAGIMFAAAGSIGGFSIYYAAAAVDVFLGLLYLKQYYALQKQTDKKKE